MADIIYSIFAFSIFILTGFVFSIIINKKFPQENIFRSIEIMLFTLGLPAFLFVSLFKSYSLNNSFSDILYALLFTVILLLNASLSALIMKATLNKETFTRSAYLLLLPNVFVFPLLFIFEEFGSAHSSFFTFAVFSVFFIPVNFVVASVLHRSEKKSALIKKNFSLLFISQILGLICAVLSLQDIVPFFITFQFDTISLLVIPLMLLYLGFYIVKGLKQIGKTNWQTVGIFILLKHILMPLLTFIFIYVFNIEYRFALIMMLLSSAPADPRVAFEKNDSLSTQIFIYSTGASILLTPVAYHLLNKIY
ncbi:MAG: hypothetical protein AB7T10_03015 [bacterium]